MAKTSGLITHPLPSADGPSDVYLTEAREMQGWRKTRLFANDKESESHSQSKKSAHVENKFFTAPPRAGPDSDPAWSTG
jgi:hypothetical protein